MKYKLKNNEPFEVSGAVDNVEKVVNVLTLGDPLIFVNFWADDRPSTPSSGQYWYSPMLNELQVYNGSAWTSVTLSLQKLYIRLATNEIYRHDGKQMIRMTINPTSLVTT